MMIPRSPASSGGNDCMSAAAKPHGVERADQVDANGALELGERHRSLAADDALGLTNAGAIDHDAGGTVLRVRLFDRGFGCVRAADVTLDCKATDFAGDSLGGIHVDVEQRNLGAGRRQLLGGGGAEARAPAGDESGMSVWIHDQAFCSVVVMTRGEGGSA